MSITFEQMDDPYSEEVFELTKEGLYPFIDNGLGRKVMAAIHKVAEQENRDVTLSSFKCNKRAVNLYKSLNYEVTEEEEHFLLFRKPHNKLLNSDAEKRAY